MSLPIAVRVVSACSALLIPLVFAATVSGDDASSGSSSLPSTGVRRSDGQPALRAAKEAQLEKFLANGSLPTAPLAGVENAPEVAGTGVVEAGGFVSKVLPLVTQRQAYAYYCIPASARAMLSRFMPASQLPSQVTLANEMGTTPAGTLIGAAPDSLNWHLPGPFWYVGDDATSSESMLWNRSTLDIGQESAAIMLRVLFGDTPYRKSGDRSGHAIVLRGYSYSTADGPESRKLSFWDPINNGSYSGSLNDSWISLQHAGRWIVW